MKRKLLSVLLAAVLALGTGSLLACGRKSDPNTVVVFSEYNGAVGSEDQAVKAAIEAKFKADTGLEINLQVETAGTDQIGQKIVTAMGDASSQIDGFICHYGSDSPINSYILDGLTMDLTQSVKELAPSYVATFNQTNDPGGLAWNGGMLDGKLYALSSKTRSSGWGMLIRRDYMEKTSFNPDDYDITKEGYKSLSVEDFKQLASELRANTGAERPIVGRPWSLDYFLTSPFGAVGYGEQILDENGNLIPAYADESYCKVLELYRWFQEQKLWIENPSNAQNVLNYFVSGRGAIYMDWPEATSQIEVARKLKEATGADCIMVAPLLAEGSQTQTNGNSKVKTAFSGLAVPLKSQNSELLLRYVEWLYADKANYELAMYGVEGEHWVAGSANGRETWDYPVAKKEQYMRAAPYSGKYCLIGDYTFSDRLYADYTDTEFAWIERTRSFPCYPAEGYVTEGMLLPKVPATDRKLRNIESAHFDEYVTLRAYAWSDAALPSGKTIESMWQTMRDNLFSSEKYFSLIEYNTQNYRKVAA